METGSARDSYLFTVELDGGQVEDLRWRELRPTFDQQ